MPLEPHAHSSVNFAHWLSSFLSRLVVVFEFLALHFALKMSQRS
jgi:hypothetical protein